MKVKILFIPIQDPMSIRDMALLAVVESAAHQSSTYWGAFCRQAEPTLGDFCKLCVLCLAVPVRRPYYLLSIVGPHLWKLLFGAPKPARLGTVRPASHSRACPRLRDNSKGAKNPSSWAWSKAPIFWGMVQRIFWGLVRSTCCGA